MPLCVCIIIQSVILLSVITTTRHKETQYNDLIFFIALSVIKLSAMVNASLYLFGDIIPRDILQSVTMLSVISDTQHNDTQYNVLMGFVVLSVVMLCVVVLSVLAAKLGGHLMRRVRKLIGEKRKKFVEPSFTLIN
jgi:hypothetical protein